MRASALLTFLLLTTGVRAADAPPLVLESKIALDHVSGRIDHLAIDAARKRLFVAELGNDTVDVIDIDKRAVIHRLSKLDTPTGVAFAPEADALFVANGGDGSVRVFDGQTFAPRATLKLDDDADNLRVDRAAGLVFAGYGAGAIAAIDAKTATKRGEMALKAHPEAFQLSPAGDRIFVNVPDAHEIAVLDRTTLRQTASWSFPGLGANFPMAVSGDGELVLAVFRSPARLAVIDANTGSRRATVSTCGDADDVFIDARRSRVYVSCGEGAVDVLALAGAQTKSIAHVPTISGARTSYYAPDLDRLFVAARASGREPAAVWVFEPN